MANLEELKQRIRPLTWGEFRRNVTIPGEAMEGVIRVVEMQFDAAELAEMPVHDVLELFHAIVAESYQRREEEKNS